MGGWWGVLKVCNCIKQKLVPMKSARVITYLQINQDYLSMGTSCQPLAKPRVWI